MSKREQKSGIVPIRRAAAPGQGAGQPEIATVDLALEAQVIGAVLAQGVLLRDCSSLEPDHFCDRAHATIWKTVLELRGKGQQPTPSTVALALDPERLAAIGGHDALAALVAQGTGLTTAVAEGAERLRQLMQWRGLADLARDIPGWARNGSMNSDQALSAAMRALRHTLSASASGERGKRETAQAALDSIACTEPVRTGIQDLDFLMHGGLMPGRLYAILGLYGRGKTILAGTISDNLNVLGTKHLFISLETRPEDIEIRSCARRLNLNAAQLYDRDDPLYSGFIGEAKAYVDQLADRTVYAYMPGGTMDEIHRAIIRNLHRHEIKGAIIDYWQLIRGRERYQTEEYHLRDCANRLNAIARKENIWILVTAQADEFGRAKYCQDGLLNAAALCIQMERGEDDSTVAFKVEKSNYSRYANSGNASAPGTTFDYAGPHFRNVGAEDVAALSQDWNERKERGRREEIDL